MLYLAYPAIYDPKKGGGIRYRGFSYNRVHSDLEIVDYITDIRQKGLKVYEKVFLTTHNVCGVNIKGKNDSEHWRIK